VVNYSILVVNALLFTNIQQVLGFFWVQLCLRPIQNECDTPTSFLRGWRNSFHGMCQLHYFDE